MKLRVALAIIICRFLRAIFRVLHLGGTTAPGRIALKICPGLLSVLAEGVHTVAITGTNGKTTEARMIEETFRDAGMDCLANRSGANLITGIATEFIVNASVTGHCQKNYAIIECDEAAARKVFEQLKPEVIVVTNLFRDQLDRYGEVTHTLENIRYAVSRVPGAKLCLNADCSLTASLSRMVENPVVWYGIDGTAVTTNVPPELSDASHCIFCKEKYEYSYTTYAHLGGFRCPKCGWARPDTDVGVSAIGRIGINSSDVVMYVCGTEYPVTVNQPAMYNIYNAAAAIAASVGMGIDVSTAIRAVGSFRSGFGRMEKFRLGKEGMRMTLVKNPAGCNQVLDFLSTAGEDFVLVACLNDRAADGEDVSWIWDADFEKLAGTGVKKIIVSGTRASDMQLRLKYAGIDECIICIERDYDALVASLDSCELPVFVMPNYTAMMDLRKSVVAHCGGRDFWEG